MSDDIPNPVQAAQAALADFEDRRRREADAALARREGSRHARCWLAMAAAFMAGSVCGDVFGVAYAYLLLHHGRL